jgi:2-dehydro-3-deoxyphosphogluconate aldolase/(4S)-4-hydroxy-2-oxoglutarate aldolase
LPSFADLMGKVRVIPVLTIADAANAVPLAQALVRGGLPVLEVTFRTAAAAEAIRRIADEVPDAIVGAGTITQPQHFADAEKAGAMFGVSPGTTQALIDAAKDSPLAYLPAAVTPGEVMSWLDAGFTHQKYFPAAAHGGIFGLNQLAGPLPGVSFCPTGGLDQSNAADYLACSNVFAVGGSWSAPTKMVEAQSWARIELLAKMAASLNAA